MELRPGYKPTELGPLPDEWEARPLAAVLSTARLGGNYANQDAETALPLMKMGNLGRGVFELSKVQFIAPGVQPDSKHRLDHGDVLFNTRNTLDLVGKVAIWRSELPLAYYNSNLLRMEFDPEQVCSNEYASYTLNTESAVSRLRGLATGTTSVAAIYTRDLLKFLFVVPPRAEQRAIAGALSDVDALLVGLDRLIAKKRDLKQAAMQQLLTGQTRLPGFVGEWVLKRVDAAGAVLAGKALDARSSGRRRAYLRTKNILDGSIDISDVLEMPMTDGEFERFRVFEGDVLLNEGQSLDLVGRCSMYRGELGQPCAMQNQLLCFRPRPNTDGAFAEHLFRRCQTSGRFASIATQTTSVAHLGTVRFASLRLHWPPTVDEQSAIAAVLSDMDSELTALEARRDKTRALKQAMMQELLTGRTRLV